MGKVRILVLLLVLGACAGARAPSPTPGGFEDIVAGLVLRGATITDQVSGDAGCHDPTLYGNAVRLDVRMPGQTDSQPIHLFGWRRTSDYEAAALAFEACVESYAASHPASRITEAEAAPWRAFGPDWSAALSSAVEQSLGEASGT